MQLSDELVILISSIGAIQSYFLGIYVLSLKVRKHHTNLLLGVLFLALAVRVSKSVLWAFLLDTPLWVINLGFAAHAASGPLFLLYVYYRAYHHQKFNTLNFLHFLPALGILLFTNKLSLTGFWYQGGYSFLLYHQLMYMAIGLAILVIVFDRKKHGKLEIEGSELVWLRNLWIGVTIWGLAYFSNYVLGLTSYLLGPMLYSVIIYVLSFYGLKNQQIFRKELKEKYKNIKITPEDISRYKTKLLDLMEKEKPYLDPNFTLTKLSTMISVPSYILSHIFNDQIKLNFPEFINTYRIREIQKKLKDPAFDHQKIASIAYECGFNSVSSFNTAFKKVTQMTPSEYKSKISQN